MSVKRQASSELNHENWDAEDPSDDKNMGQFKAAPLEVLEKRVIRTAKRRNPASSESSRSVFSGFGGFNKEQKTSFDFLANLTNGTKNTNGSTTTNSSESTTSSSLFSNKPTATSGGIFGAQSSSITSTPAQTTTWSSPFGSTAKASPSSLFSATNTESTSKETQFQTSQTITPAKPAQVSSIFGATSSPVTQDKTLTTTTNSSPFKIQPISSTATANVPTAVFQSSQTITPAKPAQISSIFGATSTPVTQSKAFTTTTNASPFKIQPISSTATANAQTTFSVSNPAPTITPEKKSDENMGENKMRYYAKLKALNEAVSDWISKHVAQTPLCILSPIFKDYDKYLKEITDEYHKNKDKGTDDAKMDSSGSTKTQFGQANSGSSTIASKDTKTSMHFGVNNPTSSTTLNQQSPFAMNNTNSSPGKSQSLKSNADSKSSGLFAFSNTSKQDTKPATLFGVNSTESKQESKSTPFNLNADSTPKKSEDTKLSSSFGIANSPSNQDSKITSPFAIGSTSSPKTSETKVNSPFAMNAGQSLFNSSTPKPSPFGAQNNLQASTENKQPSFSFGTKTSSTDSSATNPGTGFSFGVASSGSSPFSSPSTTQSTTAPFSFGTAKTFSFSTANVKQSGGESAATEENESEEPPKVEYTPVQEENSVYDKKCKIFVKKDGNFADKGVGTLYIKKIEGNAKHQLLVRANTNLGTVLLNLVLSEGIPTQRMGKNNVMMVCIPTPDAKPPPTPILIRVKTGEEADELLETLNKHKA